MNKTMRNIYITAFTNFHWPAGYEEEAKMRSFIKKYARNDFGAFFEALVEQWNARKYKDSI